MKIIRDEEGGGLFMIPLLVDWNIKRCNVADCISEPNTIITQSGEGIPVYGLCEEHFQEANAPGGATLNLEWDDFDAFAPQPETEVEAENNPQFPYSCSECDGTFMGGRGAMPGDICPICSFGRVVNTEEA